MAKKFMVKAVNPMWDKEFKNEYQEIGEFDSKDKARVEKRRVQGCGFIKVCIKQRNS